jgi:hypothetical protein
VRFCWCWLVLFTLSAVPSLEAQERTPGRALLETLSQLSWRAVELSHQRSQDPGLRREPIYQGMWLRGREAQDSSIFDFMPFASAPRNRDGAILAYDEGTGERMWAGFTETEPTRSALVGAAAHGLLALWRLLPPILGASPEVLEPRECPAVRLRFGTEVLFGFGTDGRDAPPDTRAVIAYADCRRDLRHGWHVSVGVRAYAWRTPGAPDQRDVETSLRLTREPRRDGLVLFLEGSWTPQYTRTVLHAERPLGFGRLRVRPFARVAWGENLPFCLGFWPGGFDRFPGLKAGEGRGDREVTAAVDLRHPIAGKLSARALLAVGRTSDGGPVLPTGPWLLGVRAGLNLDSRLGELRVEYGLATQNHRALFIRVGRVL